jgi:hypothetical protein
MAELDPRISEIMNRTKPGRDAHAIRERRYDRAYGVYQAEPQRKGLKKEPWESDLRIKYARQTIDTALVNLIGGKPRAKVRPRRPEDEPKAKSMQTILDYYTAEDRLSEKQPVFTQQALIYGVTAAKNHWLYKSVDRPTKRFIDNPFGQPLQIKNLERVVLRDGPTFEPWDVYDCWWDPAARDVESAEYICLRAWLTKDQLLANERTPDNPHGMFVNVHEAIETGGKTKQKTTEQERFIGGHYDRRKDKFEVVEYWMNDEYAVICNDAVFLRPPSPNPYDHGQVPIVIAQTRIDLFELQGTSETELMDHLQQAILTLHNARFDNLHMTVHRGITYREAGITDPRRLQVKPRFKWGVTDHDDVKAFDMPQLPPEAYKEDEVLLSRMQLISGINPYVSGADLNTIDQNTATGVTALQEVASRLLRFMARQLAYKGYQRTFEQWGELTKQFMTADQAIRIDRPDGAYNWENISPQEIIGSYEYAVEGTEESLSRQQERGEAIALLNAFAPFIQAGQVNFRPLLEKVAKAYDFSVEELWVQPQAQPPAAPQANGGVPGPAGGMGVQATEGPPPDPRLMALLQGGGGPG